MPDEHTVSRDLLPLVQSTSADFEPEVKALQRLRLEGKVTTKPMTETVVARACARLRTEMERTKLSQSDIANRLGWRASRVSKLLGGVTLMSVDDLEALCGAVGIAVTEAVRDHGLEFCAEMTPTEMRVLERFRQLKPDMRDAVMTVLAVNANTMMQQRRAVPQKPPKKKT
jgi:transcriptional regulator with XRE-family HTH domain